MDYIFQYESSEEKSVIIHDELEEYHLFGTLIKKERSEVILISPLNKNCSTYVYIDYPKSMKKSWKRLSSMINIMKNLKPALEVSDGGDKFIHITAQSDPDENYIMTIVSYSIPNYVYHWSTVGSVIGLFGIIALPAIYLFYPRGDTSISIIIAWSIFTITLITIIKGWLFTKTWNDKNLKIQDWFYRSMSYALALESLIIMFCYALWH